jgi:hypothetical protein
VWKVKGIEENEWKVKILNKQISAEFLWAFGLVRSKNKSNENKNNHNKHVCFQS